MNSESVEVEYDESRDADVEPLRVGRRLVRFGKQQLYAPKWSVGVRMMACKEGDAE